MHSSLLMGALLGFSESGEGERSSKACIGRPAGRRAHGAHR